MARDDSQIEMLTIEESINQMAAFVEELVARGLQALTRADTRLADEVIATDRLVDDFREQIRDRTIGMIERYAPVQATLRTVIAYQLIADELERIGDYAVHIARGSTAGFRMMPLEVVGQMTDLASIVRQQVHEGIQALAQNDVILARQICARDASVDAVYRQTQTGLKEHMAAAPTDVQDTTQLLFAMHDLERVADRVANICEDIVYIVTGAHEKLN
jgi:phosphate transport system protein